MTRPTTSTAKADLADAVERLAYGETIVAVAKRDRSAAMAALRDEGLTLRQIAELANVSNPGVLGIIRRAEQDA